MRLARAAALRLRPIWWLLEISQRGANGRSGVARGDRAIDPSRRVSAANTSTGFRGLVLLLLVMLIALFGSTAFARTVKIVQASRLELRNVTLPDGAIEEYIIITGAPAVVLIDADEVSGERLEYNKTRRKLRVIGNGS